MIYWGQKDDATLVIGKLLQAVVDNSGPQTKTYKTDRPLALEKKESYSHFIIDSHVKEQPQITTPFSLLSGIDEVQYLLSTSQNLCEVFSHFSRAVQTDAPGVVNDAGCGQQGCRPRQSCYDTWTEQWRNDALTRE